MNEKKEFDAMILNKVHRARENGIDLFPVIEFFTSNYDVVGAEEVVSESKDLLMELFLKAEDCNAYKEPCEESYLFLKQLHEILKTCKEVGKILKPVAS